MPDCKLMHSKKLALKKYSGKQRPVDVGIALFFLVLRHIFQSYKNFSAIS